jgi:hypothetical protein
MKMDEYKATCTTTSYAQEQFKFSREIISVIFLMWIIAYGVLNLYHYFYEECEITYTQEKYWIQSLFIPI